MSGRIVVLGAAVLGLLWGAAACGAQPAQPLTQAGAEGPRPSGTGFFVDPQSPAAVQAREWASTGRAADAEQLRKIADQPLPLWPRGDPTEVAEVVRDYVGRTSAARQRPLLVVENLGEHPCGTDPATYEQWIAGIVSGLGDTSSTVVLEPGGVTGALACADEASREEVHSLLADAVVVLGSAGASVYLDAGLAEAGADLDALASALRRSGVDQAHGFALNVGGTRPTAESIAVGGRLSDLLDGRRFVVDTSRNGPRGGAPAGPSTECNPADQSLGTPPTTDTGDARGDALLWIRTPGVSDGRCRPGDPAAGQWWPEQALGIARRSGG